MHKHFVWLRECRAKGKSCPTVVYSTSTGALDHHEAKVFRLGEAIDVFDVTSENNLLLTVRCFSIL